MIMEAGIDIVLKTTTGGAEMVDSTVLGVMTVGVVTGDTVVVV